MSAGFAELPIDNAERQTELEEELRAALSPGLQLVERIGAGGMGSVYRARDPALRRDVAVKVLSPAMAANAEARERFEREAAATATVKHPGVVAIHQVGRLPKSGTSYYVMEFVEGRSLAEAFPAGHSIPIPRARRIIGDLAAALAAAHARGLVHRDVKPANVLLEADSDRAVLVDFGISTLQSAAEGAADARLTVEGTSLGTPAYMSPEQASGERVDERSDVYNLGLVAFELLTGRHPFGDERTPMAMRAAHINRKPSGVATARGELDEDTAALVDRCLSKVPAARPSAASVAAMLIGDARQSIEWPPPGLDRLRTQAMDARRALWWLAASGFAVALTLHPQIPAVGPILPDDDSEIRLGIWLVLIGAAAVAWVLLLLATAGRFASMVAATIGARRLGYPWRALGRVLLDDRADTASLVNRTGAFGMLDAQVATRLEGERWASAVARWVAAAGLAILPLTLAWQGSDWDVCCEHAVPLTSLATRVAIPLILMMGVGVQRDRERRRLGRRLWRGALFREPSVPPLSVVRAWLEQSGLPARPPGFLGRNAIVSRVSANTAAVAVIVAAVVAMVIGISAATVLIGSLAVSVRGRTQSSGWLRTDGFAGLLAQHESRLNAEAARPMTSEPALDAARSLLRALGPVDTLRALSANEGVLEEIARGGPLPAYWYASAVDSMWPLRSPLDLRLVGGLARRRREAGSAALAQGAVERAEAEVRVLLAVAERMGPGLATRPARGILGDHALVLMRAIAARVRDSTWVARERALATALDGISEQMGRREKALAAYYAHAGYGMSPMVPPAITPAVAPEEVVRALAFGVCYSPRERVFGVSPTRRVRVDSVRASVTASDARRVVESQVSFLSLIEDPTADRIAAQGVPMIPPARLPFPRRVSHSWRRVVICDRLNALQ